MVKISHYEVYADSGDGWKLEGRFASDQRFEAINLSREKEAENKKVKIIRENFDVSDNSYQETVEYVSGFSKVKPKNSNGVDNNIERQASLLEDAENGDDNSSLANGSSIFKALIKLLIIIVTTLLIANVFVTLISPIVEELVDEEYFRSSLFVIFFVLFLSLAIPLVMTKIPWHLFIHRRQPEPDGKVKVSENKYYRKAKRIINLYHLNDEYEGAVSPVFPEAALELKHYVLTFMQNILMHVTSKSMFKDSLSTFGIKLIVYGGCLELAKYYKLNIAEANSLLYESFKILDGDNVDLENFYESKKSFSDNRVAIFLAGVGAHLMSLEMRDKPIDQTLLQASFSRWEDQVSDMQYASIEAVEDVDTGCDCVVNIQCKLKFFDESLPEVAEQMKQYRDTIRDIITTLQGEYHGSNFTEYEDIISVEYDNTTDAIGFAAEVIQQIGNYKEDISDDNLLFLSKCNIVKNYKDEEDFIICVADVLEHTYNNEIIITDSVKQCTSTQNHEFEFLGDKRLNKSNKLIPLYKLELSA